MSDLTIRNNILEELEFQPDIDAAAIGVSVNEGVVSLTGHVRTFAEKRHVEHAVKCVKGVRGVAEELIVRTPGGQETDDDVIASRCLDLIKWCTAIETDRVQVQVQQGWVTLEGEVDWPYQRHAIQSAARKLKGVTGINNLLRIAFKESAEEAQRQLLAAWARNAELDADHLRARWEGSTMVIEGRVRCWSERKAAERAAWAVKGVTHVINDILIA